MGVSVLYRHVLGILVVSHNCVNLGFMDEENSFKISGWWVL